MKNHLSIVTLLITLLPSALDAAEKPSKPNIVVIMADDLGWGHVGWQNPQVKTPHLDRLANAGVRLNRHYVAPVCSPTRVALFTGRTWSRFGCNDALPSDLDSTVVAMPAGTPTLSASLRTVGYRTALIGKWHLGASLESGPEKFGFDHFYGVRVGGMTPLNHKWLGEGKSALWRNDKVIEEPGHITDLLASEAVKWEGKNSPQPFFLYLAFTSPHVPLSEPEQWMELYKNADVDLSHQLYWAAISHLDDAVGKVVAEVDRLGQRDNTIFIFLSDNGAPGQPNRMQVKQDLEFYPKVQLPGDNLPLRGNKGDVYEGGVRTPGLVCWPGKLQPRDCDIPLSITDWMPTLCALVGHKPQRDLKWDGRDILPILTGATTHPESRILYCKGPNRASSVSDGQWKLIVTDKTAELYNLTEDVSEKNDLAAKNPDVVRQLRAKLASLSANDNDAVPASFSAAAPEQDELLRLIPDSFNFAAAQYGRMLESVKDDPKIPRTLVEGKVKTVAPKDWTSGFAPGSFWYLYEFTRDSKWLAAATDYTERLDSIKDYRGSHDVGFILNCSYGNGLRLVKNSAYRAVLLQGAQSLATRFNPNVGLIRSWDHGSWTYPVIVDNLMNLELLMWAAREGGDGRLREIAVSHADQTLKNHFRPDFSSFHVVDYEPTNGAVLAKKTHQGAADDSAWARGQAWGLYGYTMMFRETGNAAYLAQAKHIADFILNHPRLPVDKIPYWDFDAPGIPDAPRDASAAAVMSSALIELSGIVGGEDGGKYLSLARQQLLSLSSPAYRAKPGENGNFILMHSTGSFPGKSEVDVPLNYADYYYLEALFRYRTRMSAAAGVKRFVASEPRRLLDNGWEFYQGSLGSIWEIWRGDKASDNVAWTPVSLPHCFNARDAVDPDVRYYQGPGWYRTRLKLANPFPNGRTLLHFDGAGQKSQVFVGQKKVGDHLGGYDEWTVDITDAARDFPDAVPLAVLCDNSRDAESIPSDLSDFNRYGGIYRHVSLVYAPAISLERVHVEPKLGADGKAGVKVRARLYNPAALKDEAELSIEVRDEKGKSVHTSTRKLSPWSGEKEIAAFEIAVPKLWSPKSPALYNCTVTLKSAQGEQMVTEKFGVRSVEWVEHGPFKLNGERLLLRGTHYHEDHAGVAAAVPDRVVRQTLQAMKDMGVNFVRLGHYQQAPLVLELCDELGLLVWEEIPWCRGGLGGEGYRQQCRDMLRAMIDQHYNHASIILWGLGNENDWPGDFEMFDKAAIHDFMTELNTQAHQLDLSRQTSIRRCDFCKDIVDVYSPSIWAGWYGGRYTEYRAATEKAIADTPHFFHAEYGGDSHARRHSEEPEKFMAQVATGQGTAEVGKAYKGSGGNARASKDGDWSESYMVNLFDWHLKEQETIPNLTGAAQWIFKDFATPLRPENPVPRVNQKGVLERDGTLKESYFVFQSYWADKPMVHIYGHTWPVRWGKAGEEKQVKVFSNCREVELFVNGVSAGVKQRDAADFPAAGLHWNVKLNEGANQLRAVGKANGAEIVDEISVAYQTASWGKPVTLTLKELSRSDDHVTLEARVSDLDGVPCLDAANLVRFGLTGDGKLLDNLGTSTGSRAVQLYNGRAQISLRLTGAEAVASVSAVGIKTAFLNVTNPK